MKYIDLFYHKNNSYLLGKKAEEQAAKFLKKNSYKILATNFKTPLGEIDIIAQTPTIIIACEVKYRKDKNILPYTISNQQRTRIMNAFLLYLQKYPKYTNMDYRFDALLVDNNNTISHIQNAWEYE